MNKRSRPTLQDLARPRTLVRTYGWTKTPIPREKIVQILIKGREHESIAIHVSDIRKYLDTWCKKSFVGNYKISGYSVVSDSKNVLLIEKKEDFVYFCLYWGISQ